MESKIENALEAFRKGFNCTQAILSTYGIELGLDKDTALRISCGFGAGMGRQQETCGALTGAYMIAGLKLGRVQADDKMAQERTYHAVKGMAATFKEWNRATLCRELLGHDLNTEEGAAFIRENRLIQKICTKCIQDAATIVEAFLAEWNEKAHP